MGWGTGDTVSHLVHGHHGEVSFRGLEKTQTKFVRFDFFKSEHLNEVDDDDDDVIQSTMYITN